LGLALAWALAGCGGGSVGDVPAPSPQLKQAERVIAQLPQESALYARIPPTTGAQAPQSAALPGAQAPMAATDVLVNGGFESGSTGWSASDGVLTTDAQAHAGASYAWLGGYNNAADQLSQSITVPAGASAVTLRFWYRIVTAETLAGFYDGMLVSVHDSAGANLSSLRLYTNQDKTDGWVQSPAFDLSAFAGRTIQLRFTAVTDETEITSFLVDDAVLSVTAAAGVTLAGNQADYTIARSGTAYTVRGRTGDTTTVQAGARLNFNDATVALDTAGPPAQVYRLYKAAFNRKPDSAGLGYQIHALENTGLPLSQVSQNFISSPEFASRYGSLNDSQFVTQLYQNVLGRAPDASGLSFHVQRLSSGTGRRDVLIGFSESPENQSATGADIAGGIVFTPLDRPTTPATPSNPTCTAPKVLQNGVCVTPQVTCQSTEVLRDGVCVARTVSCVAPATLVNGSCVLPAPTCTAPKVLQNGLCVAPVTCTAPKVLQGGVCVTPPAPVPTCSATQQLVNGVCVARPVSTAPPALNGTVSLEDVILGKRTMDVPWKDLFAWNGDPSYIPVLGNNLGETVTLKVCFARTSSINPYGPNYNYGNLCTTVNSFKPNTTVRVQNAQWWAHGEFKVYVIRDAALDPSQQQVLVATYSALDWGFVSVKEPPSQCVLNGSIRSTTPACNSIAPPPEVGSPRVPTAPPAPSTGGTSGAGASAANCVAVSRAAGSDRATLTNNCGRNIFLIYCGELKYSSARCGRDSNYFTHSYNMKPGEISQTKELVLTSPTANFLFGACYGQISFGNDGDFKAWANGSYACLKPE
jgi:hypothetical protein